MQNCSEILICRNYYKTQKYLGDNFPDIVWERWSLDELSNRDYNPDLFYIMRPTNSFRDKSMLNHAIEFINNYQNKKFNSIRAVELCNQHPYKIFIEK